MKKHKWKEETRTWNQRADVCVKCGITREWQWGDYQCWKYFWVRIFNRQDGKGKGISSESSYQRPDCTPDESATNATRLTNETSTQP